MERKVEFFRHEVGEADKKEVLAVLDSLFLTTGDWTKKFETNLAKYVGASYAVGLMSCTHALEFSLRYYNIGPGDEVITTPMSFIATANAIEYVGATPVFVDVEPNTGNLDAALVERAITARTKAILPVHLYGQLCDMKALRKIADTHGLKIIEDAAHSIEGKRGGVGVGELGDIACYSFYATKNITSGEGGAITCHDQKIYEWMLKARQHGMSKEAADRYTKKYEHYDMEFLGFKCNMNNIQAALLLHQLERIETLLAKRETLARRYDQAFCGHTGIRLPTVLPNSVHSRHLYTIWVNAGRRDEYMHALQDSGIGVAVNFRAIHLMKFYREKYSYTRGQFPVAELIGDSTISIPLYPKLTEDEAQCVIDAVRRVVST